MPASGSTPSDAYPAARRQILATALAGLLLPRGARAQAANADLPQDIVDAFDRLFAGPHPGQRAVHAKGLLCEGDFVPAPDAARISRASHFSAPRTPLLVRFSNFAAVPGMPDGDPAASPRGFSVKFTLPDGGETDIVAHSYNGFPAATPEGFLRFLRSVPDAAALKALAAAEPAVRRFLDDPKPAPASYATEAYFGVNAFVFVNAEGKRQHGRYRFLPQAGTAWLTPEEAAARAPGYLATELQARLAAGPVAFRMMLQLPLPGDQTADGSRPWPEDRPMVELGTLSLRRLAPRPDPARPDLRFVPTSLVGGIEPSEDPMLLARTLAYDVSAERRAQP